MVALKTLSDTLADDALWVYVASLLSRSMARMNVRAVVLGMQAAAESGVIFDVDSLYAEGLRLARQASETWSRQMAETTREALRQAIATWQATGGEGDATPVLLDALEPMFGEARAERTAATETTRLFSDGAVLAMLWDDMIAGQRWITARDEKVCSVCGPRDGLIYPKGQGPKMPPHPLCRCAYQPVSFREISKYPRQWQGPPIAFEVRLGQ